MEFAANALFLILLVLMGKGYTITRARISTGGVIKLIVFSIFFIAMTVTMFIWEITVSLFIDIITTDVIDSK